MSEFLPDDEPAPRWRAPALIALKVAAVTVGAILLTRVLRKFDWDPVWEAIGHLLWWQIVVIIALSLIRSVVNGATYLPLITGTTLPQATVASLTGTLIQTFSPPPTDTIVRLSVFHSYGVENTRGAAAIVLDRVVQYLGRFIAPVVGLILATILLTLNATNVWMALLGAVVSAGLSWGLSVVSRGEAVAAKFGISLAKLFRKVRPTIDPAAWAAAMIQFQRESSTNLVAKIRVAVPIRLGFIAVDAIVLLACLRFVGIPGHSIGYLALLVGLLTLYPLTSLPFAGLGVLDASLIALLDFGEGVPRADMVSALLIWRAATLLFPLIPGLIALVCWRVRHGTSHAAAGVDASDATDAATGTSAPRASDSTG